MQQRLIRLPRSRLPNLSDGIISMALVNGVECKTYLKQNRLEALSSFR